jgi:hypothetical protein
MVTIKTTWLYRDVVDATQDSGGEIAGVFRNNAGTAVQVGVTTQLYSDGSGTATYGVSLGNVTFLGSGVNAGGKWTIYTTVLPSTA